MGRTQEDMEKRISNDAFFVSASFLEKLETCPRAAQFYKIDQRVSAQDSSAATFGSHIHSGLEMHMRQLEHASDKETTFRKVVWTLEQEFTKEPIEEGDFRTLNWAIEIYKHYVERFEFEGWRPLAYNEPQACPHCVTSRVDKVLGSPAPLCEWCNGTGTYKIMVEVPFVLPLGIVDGTQIYYRGFIDLPVLDGNALWSLDYKTTSRLGEDFWADKKMSAQQKGYAWALQEALKRPVTGYVVRAIRTSQMPAGVLAGKPNRVTGEVKKQSDWWNEVFAEERFYLGEDELDEWQQNALALVEEFFWHQKRNYFPRKTMWCAGKYGRCAYYEVCSTFPPQERVHILNSGLYKQKEERTL